MHRLIKTMSFGAIFFAVALGGCGGAGGDSSGTGGGGTGGGLGGSGGGPAIDASSIPATTGPYQPLVLNATWAFHVNDKGVQYDKTSVVEAMEDLGGPKAGTMGFRVKETFPSQTQLTWYAQSGQMVVRYHDQALDLNVPPALKSEDWYDPYRLRVDETPAHLVAGATWTVTFADTHTSRSKPTATTSVTEAWTVDAVDDPVAVPAGTWLALKITHQDPTSTTGTMKTYWFVRGVGKVREETDAGHIEELTSFNIPSQ
jgi:hypothetical protein